MTKETRALIEAAKNAEQEFEDIVSWHTIELTPLRSQELLSIQRLVLQLRAAISSAKAAEEGVATKWQVWKRGYLDGHFDIDEAE